MSHVCLPLSPENLEVLRTCSCWMSGTERLMLYTMVLGLQPTLYLEVGTFYGGSALIVCKAMDALGAPPERRIVCIDKEPKIPAGTWELLKHRTQMCVGTASQHLTRPAQDVQLALIDADHEGSHAYDDACKVLPCMVPGGVILFHDGYNSAVERNIRRFLAEDRVVDMGRLTQEFTRGVNDQLYGGLWGVRVLL